jgi:hypothetical protein
LGPSCASAPAHNTHWFFEGSSPQQQVCAQMSAPLGSKTMQSCRGPAHDSVLVAVHPSAAVLNKAPADQGAFTMQPVARSKAHLSTGSLSSSSGGQPLPISMAATPLRKATGLMSGRRLLLPSLSTIELNLPVAGV